MKRLTMPFLLALLSVSMAVPGCATTPPIIHNIETCAKTNVTAADVNEAVADLETQNFGDLAIEAIRIGWPTIICIIDAETANKPDLKPAGEEFKRQHVVEIRGAVSLRSPGDSSPPVPPALTAIGDFLVAPPPCYLPGIKKLSSCPGTCVEVARDGTQGVVASDGRFIPIDRSEPAWLTAWRNPPQPDRRVPPLTVYEADGCPAGWVSDGIVYTTSPPLLDCYPIKSGAR